MNIFKGVIYIILLFIKNLYVKIALLICVYQWFWVVCTDAVLI